MFFSNQAHKLQKLLFTFHDSKKHIDQCKNDSKDRCWNKSSCLKSRDKIVSKHYHTYRNDSWHKS